MTAALRRGGTDTEIVGLRHEPVGGGRLSSSHRFRLSKPTAATPPRPKPRYATSPACTARSGT
ncbi:hypothetical protein MXD62_09870, partial [Frankia sp. Mgl5]|nr:hypothetical protein [Frankia sp. Mgl5]